MRLKRLLGVAFSAVMFVSASAGRADLPTTVRVEGDSFASGAYGYGLAKSLSAYFDVISTAVGGSTMANILDRISKAGALNAYYTVIWDGSANDVYDKLVSIDTYVSTISTAVSYLTGGYVVISPVATTNSTTGTPDPWALTQKLIYDKLVEVGVNVINPLQILSELSNSSRQDELNVAAGRVPASLRAMATDNTHLNGVAHGAVAAVVAAQMVAAPVPVAAAGLPGLLGLVGFLAYRRRKRPTEPSAAAA